MIHALIYHGFPINMKPAVLERSLYHDIINQIDRQYTWEKNLVINGTWLNWDFQYACEALLSVYTPDNVFIGSTVDPWEMQSWAENKFQGSRILVFGNVDGEYGFNFWALHCDQYFPKYTISDVEPMDEIEYSYLCYQLKPKFHRQLLVHKILEKKLDRSGVITVDDSETFLFPALKKITITDYKSEWKHDYNSDQPGIGNLDVWNRCFLNIVSETELSEESEVFVSEKTWQPIIGLRPFVIHGDNRIYEYLEKNGFDLFTDIFPVDDLRKHNDFYKRTDILVDLINDLRRKSKTDLKKIWVELLPRLHFNQQRFYEFVNEQKHKVQNLF